MNRYEQAIEEKRNQAVAALNGEAGYLAGVIYAEQCRDAIRRSRFRAFHTKDEALDYTLSALDPIDLSTSEWARPEDVEVEYGDPAWERLAEDLQRFGSVDLGDFAITIEPIR